MDRECGEGTSWTRPSIMAMEDMGETMNLTTGFDIYIKVK